MFSTAGGETKLCPVCDSAIDAAARKCPHCDTDLRLFDIPGDGLDRVKPQSSAYIDDLIASISEGKEVKADIFENLKNVARGATEAPTKRAGSASAVGAGSASVAATVPSAPSAVQFECPVCQTSVGEDASVCPGCGAKFAEEAVEEFVCPVCDASVDPSTTKCLACGVTFVEQVKAATSEMPAPAGTARESMAQRIERVKFARHSASSPPITTDRRVLYKELPRLVNEVKPMLLSAKQVGVDIEEPKRLINDAIAAGKRREIELAVRLVADAKSNLETAFTVHIAGQIQTLLGEVERAKAAGSGNVPNIEHVVVSAIDLLERGDFMASSGKVAQAREEFDQKAGGHYRSKEVLTNAETLVENGRAFGIDVREAEAHIRQGRESLARRDYERAATLGERAKSAVMHVLPGVLNDAMKRARNRLLEMKMRGGDLTRAIGLLKQASIHLKREEYGDAMRYVRTFNSEAGLR